MPGAASTWFPAAYPESRQRFRDCLPALRLRWPQARLKQYALPEHPDLTIDWLYAPPSAARERLLVLTTGLHGIEGYVGTAVLRLFLAEYASRLEPASTGLLLVHAANPWGMQHFQRVNPANVDLNRNFIPDCQGNGTPSESPFDSTFNPVYRRLQGLLNPAGRLRSWTGANLRFAASVVSGLLRMGVAGVRAATLLGQYHTPQGVFYGGATWQPETRLMQELYRQHYPAYRQVVHLDIHTGYGPRYQMSLVNSSLDPASSAECVARYSYPRVVRADPDEFYAMRGDMIDYLYRLRQTEFPQVELFATAFEFGTLGDSLPAVVRALRATVFENQARQQGAASRALQIRLVDEYRALYYPQEDDWRIRVIADARQALEGILSFHGYLRSHPGMGV